jgi:5'-nucleotidase
MKRREFVQNTFLVTGGILIAGNTLAFEGKKKAPKLTILHTNDTHSNIDPFPSNHAKFPNMGGVSKRFELIEKIREEEEHVIVLDAGDIFQGTPYFNKFGGVLEIKLMTAMGYDAATMGNHDFDGGMEGFLKAQKFADFPFLCANYDFSETILKDVTRANVVIKKGKIKVGIFGIGVELQGLVPEDKFGKTSYLDPIKTANEQANILKKKGCDLIICLSHLGFEYDSDKISDKVLAQKTKNIHLILGGHTHTFLEKPVEVKNLDNQIVLINQVGWGGVQLGKLEFEFDKAFLAKKDAIIVK